MLEESKNAGIAAEAIVIRKAKAGDGFAVANLATQLGYPASEEEMEFRLQRVLASSVQTVFLAVYPAAGTIGWVHVCQLEWIMEEGKGEIIGLIVDETWRGQGIGDALLTAAEDWVRAQGGDEIILRTNVVRERAHQFYFRRGYQLSKTQHVLKRGIEQGRA